jgi:hypothetical protein
MNDEEAIEILIKKMPHLDLIQAEAVDRALYYLKKFGALEYAN